MFSTILMASVSFNHETISVVKFKNNEAFILPSFTVDATQGGASSAFIVHGTNTTTGIDVNCTTPAAYTWSLSSGVEGVDWIFVEGTSANTTNVAIQFINQGCYVLQLYALGCNTEAFAAPVDITVAGVPEISISNFTSISSCSNDNIEIQWQLASNNNLNVDFEILLDGTSLYLNTFSASPSCTTPGAVDFADVFPAGFIAAGLHTFTLTAIGDLITQSASLSVNFEVFQAPVISLNVPSVCVGATVEGIVTTSIPGTNLTFSPLPSSISISGLTATYLPGTIANGDFLSVSGQIIYPNITCISNSSQVVLMQANPVVSVQVTPPSVCNGLSATVIGTGAGDFTWTSNPLPCQINSLTNQAIYCNIVSPVSGTMTGSITYGGTGATCSTTIPFDIAVSPIPVISLVSAPESGCDGEAVTYEVSSVTTSGTAEYMWTVNGVDQANSNSPVFSTNLITPSPFEVSVQVSEPSGCVDSYNMSTLVWSNPTLTATPNTLNFPVCFDESLPMCASGAEIYDWEGSPSLSGNCVNVPVSLFSNDSIITITGSSIYGFTTCSSTIDFVVLYDLQPTIEVSTLGTACAGDDITITATGGTSYIWDSNPIPNLNSGNSITFNNVNTALISGSVIGTGINGCTLNVPFTYSINAIPVATLSNLDVDAVYCSTEPANIQVGLNFGTPPYNIDWNFNSVTQGNQTINGSTSQWLYDLSTFTNTASNVDVSITDSNGCGTSASVNLEIYPGVNFALSTNKVCEGDAVSFTANGNATFYEWPYPLFSSVVNPVTSIGGVDTESTVMPNGTFVDVTGSISYLNTSMGTLNCLTTQTASAVVEANPIISLSPISGNSFCADLNPTITSTGAESYTWSPAPISANAGTAVYPPFTSSPFTGSVTGSINYGVLTCYSSTNFSYDILNLPDVQLAVDGAIICGSSDALFSTGGMDPLNNSFEWQLNTIPLISTNNSILVPFTYPADAGINTVSCIVTDSFGCVGESAMDVEILESAQLTLTTSPICEGDSLKIDVITNGSVTWDVIDVTPTATGYCFYPVNAGDSFTASSILSVPSILLGGNYDCATQAVSTPIVKPSPVLIMNFIGETCEGANAVIEVSGAQAYSWTTTPVEDNFTVSPDLITPGLNVISLDYLNVSPGIISLATTGGITYVNDGNLTCYASSTLDVEVFVTPSFSLDGLTSICEGDCINLAALWNNSVATPSFSWTIDGVPYSTTESFNFCPPYTAGSSDISLTVMSSNSCSSSSSAIVSMSSHPIISLDADVTEGCSPLVVNFNSAVQLASVTAWNFGNGETVTGISNPSTTFNCDNYTSGPCIFEVSLTAISETNPNCTTTGYQTITVNPLPLSEFTFVDSTACLDNTANADILVNNLSSVINGANCFTGIAPYSWTIFPTGVTDCTAAIDATPNLYASGTGIFTVGLVVTDTLGCTTQTFKDFEVYDVPIPEITFVQNSVCLPLQVEILNTSSGASSFELEVPGFVIPIDFDSPYYIDVIYPGIYDALFTVHNDQGCSATIQLDTAFEAWYPPIADFTVNPQNITFLDPVVNFINLSEDASQYIWSFGDGTGSSVVDPIHEYYSAGYYDVQLLVSNEHGCSDVTTQTIKVNSELLIFVPNAFTPNNDGNNDAWIPQIIGEDLISSYKCWVFDRWGNTVFFSPTVGEAWIGDNTISGDGTHFVSSTESFSWRIEILQTDGKGVKISTGNVFLIR